jgi:hypothetical protein
MADRFFQTTPAVKEVIPIAAGAAGGAPGEVLPSG